MIWEKNIIDLGGSNALILPAEVLSYWRLSGYLVKKVRLVFEDGKLVIEPVGKIAMDRGITRPKLKLHEVICLVIYTAGGGLTATQIAEEIEKRKLYWKWTRGDIGNYPKPSQIRARIRKYPELFRKEGDRYYLTSEGLKLARSVANEDDSV